MEKIYTPASCTARWSRLALAAVLVAGTTTATRSQGLGYAVATAQNVAGTYTDLESNGALIATANNDNANSEAQNIGFSFQYNGQAFTQFVLNTNGYIKLGATAPSSAALLNPFSSTNATDVNIIAPSSYADLYAAEDQTVNPTSFRVATTGAQGSRVCTIQFKNLRDKASGTTPAQTNTLQFQIKLYEGSNVIELVYGTWTPSAAAATSQAFVVGIKGSSFSATNAILAVKSAPDAWSGTTFTAATGLFGHFVSKAALPDAGRTYRFNPPPANDASVAAIYTLGQFPIPYAAPHIIQARITNAGSTPLTDVQVKLLINGANPFSSNRTIPALAVGASTTVSFDGYTPAITGNSVITVYVPNDGNNENNVASTSQLVNRSIFGYAGANFPAEGSVGFNAGSGILLAKYTTNAPRRVIAVNADLEGTTSVGRTVYAVVCNSAGAILTRSADYIITTNDLNAVKNFPLTTPVEVASGDFFVGLAQVAAPTGTAGYFPLGTESESPTRPATFYTTSLTGGALTDVAASNLGRFMLEAVTNVPLVTANSAELKRAITAYPNPSTGLVSLDIHGLLTTTPLQVQVSNLLGQVVYTGSARNESTSTLDLSRVAAGVYNLSVQAGDQYTVQKLVIE